MRKWLRFIAIISFSLIVLSACGSSGSSKESYKVGVSQYLEHPSLDAAYEGFKEALEDADLDVDYDFQSAQGEQANVKSISDKLVADDVDLIFANATPSALGALQATKDIPIVFTSVTDAVDAGLVDAMDEPGDNITGVIDLHPEGIEKTVDFIDTYFEDATVGMIYNAGEQNSVAQIEAVKEITEGTSLTVVERTVANSSEVQQAATSLVEDADVFYIVTDNMVVSALDSVIGVTNDHDIPLIVGEPDSVEKGGFASYGIDYHTIGYRTGEMAADILTGEKSTKDLPVEIPPELGLFINKQAAEEQGIEWNDEWDDIAEMMETEE